MQRVLIYRDSLLPISETFIEAQAGALKSFEPQFVGIQRAARSLPLTNATVLGRGSKITNALRKLSYRFGFVPSDFLERLRAYRASLLHAHFAFDAASAMSLARQLDLPMVVTLHGYDVTRTDQSYARSAAGRWFLARRKALWRQASTFICVSDFIKRTAMERGFPPEKLIVHRIGIDLRHFKPRSHMPSEGIVLFVGRLVEKKGCAQLIQSMRIVQQSMAGTRLIVIGDGPLRGTLERMARELNVTSEFKGGQPADVVREWLNRATVFCGPSLTAVNGDSEGLGMVFLEAQAMGIPVVSFHHGGIPEAVRHGETGLLAPEANCEVLAQYLERYLRNPSLAFEHGRRGVQWVHSHFDLEKQTRKLEQIYRDAIARHAGVSTPEAWAAGAMQT